MTQLNNSFGFVASQYLSMAESFSNWDNNREEITNDVQTSQKKKRKKKRKTLKVKFDSFSKILDKNNVTVRTRSYYKRKLRSSPEEEISRFPLEEVLKNPKETDVITAEPVDRFLSNNLSPTGDTESSYTKVPCDSIVAPIDPTNSHRKLTLRFTRFRQRKSPQKSSSQDSCQIECTQKIPITVNNQISALDQTEKCEATQLNNFQKVTCSGEENLDDNLNSVDSGSEIDPEIFIPSSQVGNALATNMMNINFRRGCKKSKLLKSSPVKKSASFKSSLSPEEEQTEEGNSPARKSKHSESSTPSEEKQLDERTSSLEKTEQSKSPPILEQKQLDETNSPRKKCNSFKSVPSLEEEHIDEGTSAWKSQSSEFLLPLEENLLDERPSPLKKNKRSKYPPFPEGKQLDEINSPRKKSKSPKFVPSLEAEQAEEVTAEKNTSSEAMLPLEEKQLDERNSPRKKSKSPKFVPSLEAEQAEEIAAEKNLSSETLLPLEENLLDERPSPLKKNKRSKSPLFSEEKQLGKKTSPRKKSKNLKSFLSLGEEERDEGTSPVKKNKRSSSSPSLEEERQTDEGTFLSPEKVNRNNMGSLSKELSKYKEDPSNESIKNCHENSNVHEDINSIIFKLPNLSDDWKIVDAETKDPVGSPKFHDNSCIEGVEKNSVAINHCFPDSGTSKNQNIESFTDESENETSAYSSKCNKTSIEPLQNIKGPNDLSPAYSFSMNSIEGLEVEENGDKNLTNKAKSHKSKKLSRLIKFDINTEKNVSFSAKSDSAVFIDGLSSNKSAKLKPKRSKGALISLRSHSKHISGNSDGNVDETLAKTKTSDSDENLPRTEIGLAGSCSDESDSNLYTSKIGDRFSPEIDLLNESSAPKSNQAEGFRTQDDGVASSDENDKSYESMKENSVTEIDLKPVKVKQLLDLKERKKSVSKKKRWESLKRAVKSRRCKDEHETNQDKNNTENVCNDKKLHWLSQSVFDIVSFENHPYLDSESMKNLIKKLMNVIEKQKNFYLENVEKLKRTSIEITWEMSDLHKNQCSVYRISDQHKYDIQKGPFSEIETEQIMERWMEFCKIYDFDPKVPECFIPDSINGKHSKLLWDTLLNFVRFIAQDLPYRSLPSVYGKFEKLFMHYDNSGYTQTEDNILLLLHDASKKFNANKNIYRAAALLLNRSRQSVYMRYRRLLVKNVKNTSMEVPTSWTKVLKAAVKVHKSNKRTEVLKDSYENFTLKEWKKIADLTSMKSQNAKALWLMKIKPLLVAKNVEISKSDLLKNLIKSLYNNRKIKTWNNISWESLSDSNYGFGPVFLFSIFYQFVNEYVPQEHQSDYRDCMNYLITEVLPKYEKESQNQLILKSISHNFVKRLHSNYSKKVEGSKKAVQSGKSRTKKVKKKR